MVLNSTSNAQLLHALLHLERLLLLSSTLLLLFLNMPNTIVILPLML